MSRVLQMAAYAAFTLLTTINAQVSCPNVTVVFQPSWSSINTTTVGCADNKYGIEDDTVIRTGDGVFYLLLMPLQ
jgi:hypothetical protein